MVPAKLTEGYLFDIQGFSVHDGPGCRTLIFLKGCSLKCSWCSNPEGLKPFPEPLYNSSKCIFDNLCIEACRKSAITANEQSLHFDTSLCRECDTHECATACCTGALKTAGYKISGDKLMKILKRDRQYWGNSGGITLTGGEPFLQPVFVKALLQQCHQSYIHTAAETCGNVVWNNIKPSLEYLDWIFYDLKHMDDSRHKATTGSGNKLILENARKLAAVFAGRLIFRMPVVPEFNDDEEHIRHLSAFMNSIGKKEINILPLHHLGREKYNLLGQKYSIENFIPPSKESLLRLKSLFSDHGVQCFTGSETPF
jgi:pyruvate formate lyase activating enzyme